MNILDHFAPTSDDNPPRRSATPRVFVVNEPLRRDPVTGSMMHVINVAPAQQYGELIFLLPPGRPPPNHEESLELLREKLSNFTHKDYLLPVGHTAMIAYAGALAARASGGILRLLVWDSNERAYLPTHADVYQQQTELEEAQ